MSRTKRQHGGRRTSTRPPTPYHRPAAQAPRSHHERAPGQWMPLSPPRAPGRPLPTLDDYDSR